MRGHDQTIGRALSAWFWCILVATVAVAVSFAFAADTVRAQESAGPDAGTPGAARASEPIVLAAERVRVWRSGDEQWMILSGQVSILQGVEGPRAEQAVVQIVPVRQKEGTIYRLEVYAEGVAREPGRPGAPARSARFDFTTDSKVRLEPYEAKGLIPLPGPPKDQPILARALAPAPPSPRPAPEIVRAPAPAPAPTPAPAPGPRLDPVPAASSPAPVVVPSGEPIARGDRPPAASVPPEVLASTTPDRSPTPSALPPLLVPSADPAAPPASPTVGTPSGQDAKATADRAVVPTQFMDDDSMGSGAAGGRSLEGLPPAVESETEDVPVVPNLSDEADAPGTGPPPLTGPETDLAPLPGQPARPRAVPSAPGGTAPAAPPLVAPIYPGTQRLTRIMPRNGGPDYSIQTLKKADNVETTIVRGGVFITAESPDLGIVDMEADSAIIWRRHEGKGKGAAIGPDGTIVEDAGQPMEVYLEGNVVIKQDARTTAGNSDQKSYRSKQAFYDLRSSRFIGLTAEMNMFAPGLIAPTRIFAPRIDQYRPVVLGPDGKYHFAFEEIRADNIMGTGSRFPTPGYRFTSSKADITKVVSTKTNPSTGRQVRNPKNAKAAPDTTWRIDSRNNLFFLGPVPIFYYPRFVANADDLQPVVKAFIYRTNNYFGQQFLADLNGFRVLGIQRPQWIDAWNLDVDYLSARGMALGSETGWFGKDIIGDLTDPYRQDKDSRTENVGSDGYFGYFDIWGLPDDRGNDVLGSGPSIITNNIKAGNKGFQRSDTPSFQKTRGRITFRHMQSLLDADADPYEDFRLQIEAAYISDRYFLEEYYKRLNETGLDQETLAYMVRQKNNTAWSIWTEANLQSFNTETQWLPRLDYYRLGDAPLGNWLTYFQHSGIDYASTHTAVEVANPHVFAFIPYDPTSNTRGTLNSGRAYTNHEVDLPLKFGTFRVVPYAQGQLVGWSNQLDGQPVGRAWGGVGARADFMIWKAFPGVESELFNVHGLNHKVNFEFDYRDAWSNVKLNTIGVQDDLDDNTYEGVRRYFAMTEYVGGVLPAQYDPRHLILRRTLSPISGPTDIQASINTLQMNIHSRLQTKRGPEGRRRVIDYMTLDLTSTYFPQAARDNFGKSFGQSMYNWQWFIGDRTSIISYGWFEFFNIGGQPTFKANPTSQFYPFGVNVITSGISINRPPRGSIFIGYTVLDTGPITTSALNGSLSYWLSPKWYGTFSNSYDFGNRIPLASMFSLTRIGADYLIAVGLVVDPQRNSYMAAFQISPRVSPNIRLGSGVSGNQFDSRYAPTQ